LFSLSISDLVSYLPWLLSAISIWQTVLAGNLNRNAWLIGLFNQVLWLIWIILSKNWGLLPMNIAMWIVYIRNHRKWRKQLE
jgi:hypothetical protein